MSDTYIPPPRSISQSPKKHSLIFKPELKYSAVGKVLDHSDRNIVLSQAKMTQEKVLSIDSHIFR